MDLPGKSFLHLIFPPIFTKSSNPFQGLGLGLGLGLGVSLVWDPELDRINLLVFHSYQSGGGDSCWGDVYPKSAIK